MNPPPKPVLTAGQPRLSASYAQIPGGEVSVAHITLPVRDSARLWCRESTAGHVRVYSWK